MLPAIKRAAKTLLIIQSNLGLLVTNCNIGLGNTKEQEVEKESSLKFIELSSFGIGTEHSKETVAAESTGTPQITLTFPNGMCLKIY